MLPENNRILFGDWSSVRTFLVFTWRCTILVASLLGNTVIMIAIAKHQAIRLGQVTTTLISHITVSDLCLAVFGIGPMLIFTLMGGSGSAELLCMVSCCALGLFITSSLQLVCVLNVCKLVIVQFPLRCQVWKGRFAHFVASVPWAWSVLTVFISMGFNGGTIYFDHRIRSCMFVTKSESLRWFRLVAIVFSMGIPGVLIMISTAWLLYIAHQQAKIHNRNSLQIQSIVTAIAVAIAYCLSNFPFSVSFVYNVFLVSDSRFELSSPTLNNGTAQRTMLVEYDASQSPVSSFMYNYFYLISCLLTLLNSAVNFFIYKASITSFRKCVEEKITRPCLRTAASLFASIASCFSHLDTMFSGFATVAPVGSKNDEGTVNNETAAVTLVKAWETVSSPEVLQL